MSPYHVVAGIFIGGEFVATLLGFATLGGYLEVRLCL